MNDSFTTDQQFAILTVLTYLSDLFTAAKKEQFDRVEVLRVLNITANDPDFIDPAVAAAFQAACADLESC